MSFRRALLRIFQVVPPTSTDRLLMDRPAPAYDVAAVLVVLGVVFAGVFAAEGCGKKGPPLPPLRTAPEKVSGLRVRQVGDRLVLSFARPTARDDGSPLGPRAVVEILMTPRDPAPRRASEIQQEPALTWTIPAEEWPGYSQGERLDVALSLARIAEGIGTPAGADALKGRKLSFIAQVVEPKNKHSIPSDIETFIICSPPPAPASAAGRLVEEGLALSWGAGDGAGTAAVFNIYRQEEGRPSSGAPINSQPLAGLSYTDTAAILGRAYRYHVRAVAGEARCESADAPEVRALRVDLFPPAPPQGLAAVAEQGVIRLFWRPNRESDLAGYRVYRADGPAGALRLLTPEPLTATTYTDKDVPHGVVYSYAVTALDGAGPPNESLFSDQASEILEGGG